MLEQTLRLEQNNHFDSVSLTLRVISHLKYNHFDSKCLSPSTNNRIDYDPRAHVARSTAATYTQLVNSPEIDAFQPANWSREKL